MNYIELINQFWRIRRSKRITSTQADLYYFLLQECNSRNWENPFEIPNNLICASIGISEPTLIDARNRLLQLGLIDVIAGKRNVKSPVYSLNSNLSKLSRNRTKPLDESKDEPEQPPKKKGEPIKNKQNQTKPNNITPSIPQGGKGGEDFYYMKLGYWSGEEKVLNEKGREINLPSLLAKLHLLKIPRDQFNQICILSNKGEIGHPIWKILNDLLSGKHMNLHSPGALIIKRLKGN